MSGGNGLSSRAFLCVVSGYQKRVETVESEQGTDGSLRAAALRFCAACDRSDRRAAGLVRKSGSAGLYARCRISTQPDRTLAAAAQIAVGRPAARSAQNRAAARSG